MKGNAPRRSRWNFILPLALVGLLLWMWVDLAPLRSQHTVLGLLSRLLPLGAILFVVLFSLLYLVRRWGK